MKVHKNNFSVSRTDIDENNHVNNLKYLEWVIDISKQHWAKEASLHDQEKYIWMVRSHQILYKKQCYLDDELIIKTYIDQCRGPISTRVVEIIKEDQTVMTCKSTWCLIVKESMSPDRIPEYLQQLFM